MCVCVCIYIYVYIYMCVYIYIYIYRVNPRVCVALRCAVRCAIVLTHSQPFHSQIWSFTCVCVCGLACVCVCVCVCVCLWLACVGLCVCVCVCVCVCCFCVFVTFVCRVFIDLSFPFYSQIWPAKFEELLESVRLPDAELNLDLPELVRAMCGARYTYICIDLVLDVDIYMSICVCLSILSCYLSIHISPMRTLSSTSPTSSEPCAPSR